MKNAERLAMLDVHRRRLEHLVGEMLRKADELDQSSQFNASPLSDEWHSRLSATCTDLVSLSEAVTGIQVLIDKGDLDAAQTALLRSTDIASHLSRRLRDIKHAAATSSPDAC